MPVVTLQRKAVQGVAWNAAGEWGRVLVAFLVFAALAHILAPRAFGLVALGLALVGVAKILTEQGLVDALIQREDPEPGHHDTVFWTLLLAGAALTGLVVLAAPFLATLLRDEALGPVLRWLAPLFVLHALVAVQEAVLKRDLDFKSLALRNLAGVVVGGGVALGLALAGYGVWALVAQQLAIGTTDVLVLWGASSWRPGLRASARHLRELWSFGAPVTLTNLLGYAREKSDDLIIGAVLGATALGYYVVAYRILEALRDLLTGVVGKVAFPAMSRLEGDGDAVGEMYLDTVGWTSLLALPAFLGALVVAPTLVPVVYGPTWTPSVPVVQVLLLAGLAYVALWPRPALLAMGKPRWELMVAALEATLTVTAFLVAVRWGLVAVAAGFVASRFLTAPLVVSMLHRLTGLTWRDLGRSLLPSLLTSVPMALLVLLVTGAMPPLPGILLLVAQVVLGVAVYAVLLRVVAPGRFREGLQVARNLLTPREGAA